MVDAADPEVKVAVRPQDDSNRVAFLANQKEHEKIYLGKVQKEKETLCTRLKVDPNKIYSIDWNLAIHQEQSEMRKQKKLNEYADVFCIKKLFDLYS